jgi:hypothetical protein
MTSFRSWDILRTVIISHSRIIARYWRIFRLSRGFRKRLAEVTVSSTAIWARVLWRRTGDQPARREQQCDILRIGSSIVIAESARSLSNILMGRDM